MNFTETLQSLTGKPLSVCTNQELYLALLELVRRKSADRVQPVTGRKLYYISAEFLIGKLLSNNLINLGLYDEARDALAAAGKNLADIEEVEPEPSPPCIDDHFDYRIGYDPDGCRNRRRLGNVAFDGYDSSMGTFGINVDHPGNRTGRIQCICRKRSPAQTPQDGKKWNIF